MMIRIRTKLLLYFMIVFMILNAVAFLFYKSSEKIVSEYDDSFEKFLLLNDISQQVNLVHEKMQSYIVEEEDTFLKDYFRARKQLLTYQGQLTNELSNENNAITLSNYKNIISSYIEATDLTIGMFQNKEINRYSTHLNEATKFAGFIQETTLSLVNNELTDYQLFYQEIEKQNRYFNLMGMSLFSSTFLLSLLLALWLSGGITKPIRQLSKAATEISEGNFSGDEIKVTTNDELKLLTNTFNQMRLNIRQLVSEIKEQSELDKLLKEMELKSLQNQINPHFLFNTLNTVSKMAYLEEAQNTSRLIEAIAALLRYNLGDLHKSSTLQNEVKIVKEYFYIQRTRFGERIDFKMDVDPDCLNIEIPSLSLQPIVENAFIHGIESMEDGGIIKLNVFRMSNRICVEITDNGAGMDENTLTKLRQLADGTSQEDGVSLEKSTGHSTGIGIKNVIQRLQLFYKRMDVVEIESIKDSGTTFRLLLPYDQKRGWIMIKVMIVDDELFERKAITKIIQTECRDVEVIGEAPNGRVAIEKATHLKPDLILMDIKMPGIDGVEAVKRIKQLHPDIKFIMVSAFNTFEYAKEVMQQGVKEYILKPSRKADVIAAIDRVKTEITEERRQIEEQAELKNRMKELLVLAQKEGITSISEDHPHSTELWKSNQLHGILSKAKKYIDLRYYESLTLEEVAEYVELSPYHFSKLFKEKMGVTFIDYLTTVRVDHAKKEMDDPSKSLKEICYSVGYKDPNYFSRVFKKYTGMSPSEYRSITLK